ncbi:MAG: lytic murein transglycosylase [Desulfuromusa sp.]
MKKTLIGFCFLAFVLLLTFSQTGWAGANADYSHWLEKLRTEAQLSGIKVDVLNAALADVKPLDWIIKLDRAQPEFKKTLPEYLAGAVTSKRIKRGQQLLSEDEATFVQISRNYQVQPRFLLALWGIETNFGVHTGKVPVIAALVTLAFDGRRSDYFRQELLYALQILDQDHIQPDQMKGSWAGAMGQVQFMPSSFLNYAVDGNGDGRIDLWNTRKDYLSSAANYLARLGWDDRYTWGREVTLPENLNAGYLGLKKELPLSAWQKLGIRTIERKNLPVAQIMASLIQPDGSQGRAFLVYSNYRVLLKWNRAHRFAIAVGTLADRIGNRQPK